MRSRKRGIAVALVLWGASGTSLLRPAEVWYSVEVVAGTDSVGDGGPALAARLNTVKGLAVGARGNIYISDTDNHRVRMIAPTGTITTMAGNGYPGFGGDGGPAVSAQLNQPWGLAADGNGNLYIGDVGNNRVRRISSDGRISTIAGFGEMGTLNDGDALSVQLLQPRYVAADASGNVYFSEWAGHRVRRITRDGRVETVAGTGVRGFDGNGGFATQAKLASPAGVAVDRAGGLYIADNENSVVRKVERGVISLFWKQKSLPVSRPLALAFDQAENLYITYMDKSLERVSIVGTAMGFPKPVPLVQPAAVALDKSNSILVPDGCQVKSISPAGETKVIAGDGTCRSGGDGAAARSAMLWGPTGLALDPAGNLFVSDTGNQRIRKIDQSGVITTIAGDGTFGFKGDGSPASRARLFNPEGLAFDSGGNLIVADTGNCRIRRIDTKGIVDSFAGASCGSDNLFWSPRALALDRAGNIYVSDATRHRVVRITKEGKASHAAGNGSQGSAGDGNLAQLALLDSPMGLAAADSGILYIADSGNQRIRIVARDGMITTLPTPEFSLSALAGLMLDSEGNLFIADTWNQRILRVDADGKVTTVTTRASLSEGDVVPGQPFHPYYLLSGPQGSIFASDPSANRVYRLVPHEGAPFGELVQQLRVLNAASMLEGAVSPGEIVSIFGPGLGPASGVSAMATPEGVFPKSVGETEVTFDDQPGVVLYAQSNQINVIVPYGVQGKEKTGVAVIHRGRPRGSTVLQVAEAAPGLFSQAAGKGMAAAINQDTSLNTERTPAPRGSIVTFYATGEGQTDPEGADGRLAVPPLPKPVQKVSLTIGGFPAEILYAGSAPGYAGLMQVNARVPGGFAPTGILPVILWVGDKPSQPGVTVAVR